jgi:hypothetical protein
MPFYPLPCTYIADVRMVHDIVHHLLIESLIPLNTMKLKEEQRQS